MSNIDVPLPAAEYIGVTKKWQDLPSEIILKILSYSEVKDRISCGQVSKRTRSISHERSLWVTANLEKKIVKTELLEMILRKGCRTLNLICSTILGSLSSNSVNSLKIVWLRLVMYETGRFRRIAFFLLLFKTLSNGKCISND